MSEFNLALLKKHKVAVGVIVVVGGIAVFYALSSSGSAATDPTAGSDSDFLAASSAEGQAQAAAAVQTNAQNAAIQQASIAAQVANNQTAAGVSVNNTNTLAALVAALNGNSTDLAVTQSNNDAATVQQKNTETANQNIFSIQEAGIVDQINQAGEINANNNATSLAGLVDTLNYQGQVANQVINSATTLSQQQETDYENNVQALAPTFGKQYNSALDANDAAVETLTVLSGGNPSVAGAGVYSSASSVASGNNANASIVNNITNSASKIAASIGNGLFA